MRRKKEWLRPFLSIKIDLQDAQILDESDSLYKNVSGNRAAQVAAGDSHWRAHLPF